MRVSVIGTGYVGLVSGVCLAAKGHQVICVDRDHSKVSRINRGESPIYEAGLDQLLKENAESRLEATTDLEYAVANSELSIIAVGTPFDGSRIDLTAIKEVSREIGQALAVKAAYHVVVVKSTVVPGTTDTVVRPIIEKWSGKTVGTGFGIGMNPEFLREGEAVNDFMHPDRIVLGAWDGRTSDSMAALYSPFGECPLLKTNNKTAEMIKYASNALFATLISYSNEIGNLCAAEGDVDAVDVLKGVHLDRRISPVGSDGTRITPGLTSYLQAGCGFGGSCFPKDVKALAAHGMEKGLDMGLLNAVLEVNARQPMEVVAMLRRHFPELEGLPVTVLGLAFKPGTDDMRESPALPVMRYLSQAGAIVKAFDPVANEEASRALAGQDISLAESIEDAIDGSSAILIMTAWPEFEQLPGLCARLGLNPLVIDGRRLLARESCERYEGIGVRVA